MYKNKSKVNYMNPNMMHNGNHNMNNIPSLVSNIEQNMEMYGNTNKNNYIPIEQHNMQHNIMSVA